VLPHTRAAQRPFEHHDVSSHTSSMGREPSHCQSHQQPTLPTLSRATNNTHGVRILRFRQSAVVAEASSNTAARGGTSGVGLDGILHVTASDRHGHSLAPQPDVCAVPRVYADKPSVVVMVGIPQLSSPTTHRGDPGRRPETSQARDSLLRPLADSC
jgi:hypothetical protein